MLAKKTERRLLFQTAWNKTKNSSTSPSSSSSSSSSTSSTSSSSSSSSISSSSNSEDARDAILNILTDVGHSGSFAVGGPCHTSMCMPGLSVNGLGKLGLPLNEIQANALKGKCVQIPDCNSWSISSKEFELHNPEWTTQIAALKTKVCESMGVDSQLSIEAQLSHLVLYESSKNTNTLNTTKRPKKCFGTLLISLPSIFKGGKLTIKNAEDVESFDDCDNSEYNSHYISFYSDCNNELETVTSGLRLCLVYNLINIGDGAIPKIKSKKAQVRKLEKEMIRWSESFVSEPRKLVFVLDEDNEEEGEAMTELLKLAEESDVQLCWTNGTIDYVERGSASVEYDDDNYGSYHRHYRGEPEYEWLHTTSTEYNMTTDLFEDIQLKENELEPTDFFEDKEHEDEEFEGDDYGEGGTGIRTYASENCLVVFPKSACFEVVTGNDVRKMIAHLEKALLPDTKFSESIEKCLVSKVVLFFCFLFFLFFLLFLFLTFFFFSFFFFTENDSINSCTMYQTRI